MTLVTVVRPTRSSGYMTETTAGIHPTHSAQYIRRLQGEFVMAELFHGRTLHKFDPECAGNCPAEYCFCDRTVAAPAEADVVSSILPDGQHMPVIDLDLSCEFVPSATPGHHHLYINKAMDWAVYADLLTALARAGVIELGYCKASQARGYTSVRVPWKPKVLQEPELPQPLEQLQPF